MKKFNQFKSANLGFGDLSLDEKELYLAYQKDKIERRQERNLKIASFFALGMMIGLIYLILFN
jgi:hypothetical protein